MSETTDNLLTSRSPIGRVAVQTIHLAGEIGRSAAWADRIAALRQPSRPAALAAGLFERWRTTNAPGMRAADLARRFVLESLAVDVVELTISPYAPPVRQISTARQGAPMWSPGTAQPAAPPPRAVSAHAEPAGRPPARDEVPADLRALLELHRSLGRI